MLSTHLIIYKLILPENKDISFSFSNLKDGFSQTLTVLQDGRETKAERKEEIDLSNVNLQEYTGNYYSKELDVTYNFKLKNGILQARIVDKDPAMDCTIVAKDQFVVPFGILRFQRNNGRIASLELDSGRVKNLRFQKR